MPRLIKLDKKTNDDIAKVKEYAAQNIFDEHALLAIKEKISPLPEDDPNFVVHIHQNFKVVYTIDTIDNELYQHLSILYKDGCPGIAEAIVILKVFNMADDIHDLDNVWLEEASGKEYAVHLLKKKDNESNN